MEQLFIGIDGVEIVLDDILVTGKNRKEHQERLIKVLDILQKNGLKVKKDKCLFFQKSVFGIYNRQRWVA